jgi:TonB family protein
VHIRFTVSGAGTVKNARVVKSSDQVFETAALRAVEQWKYQPQMEAGKPVDRDTEVIYRFDPRTS